VMPASKAFLRPQCALFIVFLRILGLCVAVWKGGATCSSGGCGRLLGARAGGQGSYGALKYRKICVESGRFVLSFYVSEFEWP
jgi:hypothetical protein